MTRVLMLGATSGIAEAVGRIYAVRGSRMYLVARDPAKLSGVSSELGLLGAAEVRTALADLARPDSQGAVLGMAWSAYGGFDRVIIAYGILPDEAAARSDWKLASEALQVNLSSVVTLLDRLLERCDRAIPVRIGVIGSVAGDRGRARVAVYAAAKGGLERYVEALQQREQRGAIRLTMIKPGWVRTRMTAGMPKSVLIASPERAAQAIVRAVDRGSAVAYVPGWWRLAMLAVRSLPGSVFRRLEF